MDGFPNTYTDNQTAVENYEALKVFFSSYSEYKTNEFYITGESYAGHYIPTLTYQIYTDPNSANHFNFKGYMIGNPSTTVRILVLDGVFI